MIELRDEVLDEVKQLYFERRRVLLERRSARADRAEAERLAPRARESRPASTPGPAAGWAAPSFALAPCQPAGGTTMTRVAACALALALLGAAPAARLAGDLRGALRRDGADDGARFVELYGAPGTSLDGLVLEGVNGADGDVTHTLTLRARSAPTASSWWPTDERRRDLGGATPTCCSTSTSRTGPTRSCCATPRRVLDALGYGVFAAGRVLRGGGSAGADPPRARAWRGSSPTWTRTTTSRTSRPARRRPGVEPSGAGAGQRACSPPRSACCASARPESPPARWRTPAPARAHA